MAISVAGRRSGYAQRFENRPEFRLFGALIKSVIDATNVRERPSDGLRLVRLKDIFEDPSKEILIGFGQPNAWVSCGDDKGGVQKFAGKSLKRAVSKIEDTRGWVQSGVIVRLINLPPHAQQALREAMQHYHDQHRKFWTCVNACLHVMERAGFSAARGKALTERYWPYALLNMLVNEELLFEGKPVEFEVVRTTPFYTQRYALMILIAELMTFWRHFKKTKPGAFVSGVLALPGKLLRRKSKQHVVAPVAPALPDDLDFASDIRISVSRASLIGVLLRQIWGPHALFRGQVERVNIREFIGKEDNLKPFPVVKNFVTGVKKTVLFSRPVIWLIRRLLCPRWEEIGVLSETHIYDMMRTHSEVSPNKYNMSITEDGITISRINVGWKLIDWILSKHLVVTGYDPNGEGEPFCGECWKDEQGRIHISPNSGTFQPKRKHLTAAGCYARKVFPHWEIVLEESELKD